MKKDLLVILCFLFSCSLLAQDIEETKTEIDWSGYARLRMTQENNYNSWYGNFSNKNDNFIDARSYVSMRVTHGSIQGVVSIDIAGDDFNDGVEWGNPIYTPGVDTGPGFQREWGVGVRHLYLQYQTPFIIAQVGRMPAGLGNGIVGHVNRDALRLIFPIEKQRLVLVAIKGANDRVTIPETLNSRASSEGAGDLNAFVGIFAYNIPSILNSRGQIYAAKQQNTREDPFLPQYPGKLFIGITNNGSLGALEYNFEAASLTGESAVTPASDLKKYSAYMTYLKLRYNANNNVIPKFLFGRGSGDDKSNPDRIEDFEALFLDANAYSYTNIFADDIHGFRFTNPGSVRNGSGFANVTWFQIGLDAILLNSKLMVDASYTLLTATEARTVGTGIFGTHIGETTNDIGSEINFNAYYKLSDGLGAALRTGLFIPGDIYGDHKNVAKIELFTEFSF